MSFKESEKMERISNYNPAKGDVQCLDMWTEPRHSPDPVLLQENFYRAQGGIPFAFFEKMQSRAAEGVAKQHLGNQQSPYRKAGRVPTIHL